MKINYGQLLVIKEIFDDIINQDLDIGVAVKIARFMKNEFDKEYLIYDEQRVKICEKNCRKDEKGMSEKDKNGNYQFDVVGGNNFVEEYNKLATIEIDINFPFESVKELGNIKIKPKNILILQEMNIIKEVV